MKGDIKIVGGKMMVGEIGARLSGGFMSTHTYPLATGVDLMKAVIELAIGAKPSDIKPKYSKVAIERAIIPGKGKIQSIKGLEEAKNVNGIKDIFITARVGQVFNSPRSNVEGKAGHIIAVGDSLKSVEESVRKCKNILKIKTITY
jgi:biotin carboxylase